MHKLTVGNQTNRPFALRKPRSAASGFLLLRQASLLLQKKPSCPCGGGCPRCKNKLPVQTKLAVSEPGDVYEQEADRVAEQVMRMPAPVIQRSCASCTAGGKTCPKCAAEEKLSVHRKAGSASNESAPPVSENVLSGLGPGRPLDAAARDFFEPRFGRDLGAVRVHHDEPAAESAEAMNALAYTIGNDIVLGRGQYAGGEAGGKLLAHELTHVAQQTQGRALGGRPQALQRQVRIDGGKTRVNEAEYQRGGAKDKVGSRHSVASLIADGMRRVFASVAELDNFADGRADHIGDVLTKSAGAFWYRLPETQLTVLGERHENPNGNVEDVILGLRTSRFMYEPFNELTDVAPFAQADIGTGTQSTLAQVHGGVRVAGQVDRAHFNPDLENIVIKAFSGVVNAREYVAANPRRMKAADQKTWGARASTGDYSFGERTALYLSFAMHLAQDIAQFAFGAPSRRDSAYVRSGRSLAKFYNAHQTVLDAFMQAKDSDDLIGIFELTSPNRFRNLSVIKDFTVVFHEFASRYIEELGTQMSNATLQTEGKSLARNRRADLDDLSPAREEIMWGKIQHAQANGYLIVGMGEAHRSNLQPRLTQAGIRNEEVASALVQQRTDIDANWAP